MTNTLPNVHSGERHPPFAHSRRSVLSLQGPLFGLRLRSATGSEGGSPSSKSEEEGRVAENRKRGLVSVWPCYCPCLLLRPLQSHRSGGPCQPLGGALGGGERWDALGGVSAGPSQLSTLRNTGA